MLNLFKNMFLACLFSLCNVIDFMGIFFSVFDKINAISSHITCSTACGKLAAYADRILYTINCCFTPMKILGCFLMNMRMLKPVLLIFRLYGRILEYFLDISNQLGTYGVRLVVEYFAVIWKMMPLPPTASALVSGDRAHVISLDPRPLLKLVFDCISRLTYHFFDFLFMALKLLLNGSCKSATNELRMRFDQAVNGWDVLTSR